jgi:hypothetical protein
MSRDHQPPQVLGLSSQRPQPHRRTSCPTNQRHALHPPTHQMPKLSISHEGHPFSPTNRQPSLPSHSLLNYTHQPNPDGRYRRMGSPRPRYNRTLSAHLRTRLRTRRDRLECKVHPSINHINRYSATEMTSLVALGLGVISRVLHPITGLVLAKQLTRIGLAHENPVIMVPTVLYWHMDRTSELLYIYSIANPCNQIFSLSRNFLDLPIIEKDTREKFKYIELASYHTIWVPRAASRRHLSWLPHDFEGSPKVTISHIGRV